MLPAVCASFATSPAWAFPKALSKAEEPAWPAPPTFCPAAVDWLFRAGLVVVRKAFVAGRVALSIAAWVCGLVARVAAKFGLRKGWSALAACPLSPAVAAAAPWAGARVVAVPPGVIPKLPGTVAAPMFARVVFCWGVVGATSGLAFGLFEAFPPT